MQPTSGAKLKSREHVVEELFSTQAVVLSHQFCCLLKIPTNKSIEDTQYSFRYKIIKEVGDGTFGNVWRAINNQTNEIVAIKKMKKKYCSWEECFNLREVKSVRRMNHPNIVKLKEVIREDTVLYFVFEYMECSLYQLMMSRCKPFSEDEIRSWCFQVFQALAYMHQMGYFHRDLKPENLLATKDFIKVADFGLAREVASGPPYTEYVSTRWYRAPEILLQSSVYDSAVDAWAMGAIMAELFTLQPLFPGSSEPDEIYKICSVIGTPNQNSWAEGLHLADAIKFRFPQFARVHLPILIPSASVDAIHLISSLCSWDPCKRPTASEALKHSFFQSCCYIPPSLHSRSAAMPKTPPVRIKGALDDRNARGYSTGALSNTKPATYMTSSKLNAFGRTVTVLMSMLMEYLLSTYVLRNREMNYTKSEKNEMLVKNIPKQRPYQLPTRGNAGYPCRNSGRVFEEAERLAQLTLNSSRASDTWETPVAHLIVSSDPHHLNVNSDPHHWRRAAPPVEADGWHSHTTFLGQRNVVPSGKSFSRKAVH